jgi:hypothetical protein
MVQCTGNIYIDSEVPYQFFVEYTDHICTIIAVTSFGMFETEISDEGDLIYAMLKKSFVYNSRVTLSVNRSTNLTFRLILHLRLVASGYDVVKKVDFFRVKTDTVFQKIIENVLPLTDKMLVENFTFLRDRICCIEDQKFIEYANSFSEKITLFPAIPTKYEPIDLEYIEFELDRAAFYLPSMIALRKDVVKIHLRLKYVAEQKADDKVIIAFSQASYNEQNIDRIAMFEYKGEKETDVVVPWHGGRFVRDYLFVRILDFKLSILNGFEITIIGVTSTDV